MRWSDDEVLSLKEMFSNSMYAREIAIELNRTEKSVLQKIFKLGLFQNKRNFTETLNCIECSKEFTSRISLKQKFCSQTCSATHNNRIRYAKPLKSNCAQCNTEILTKSINGLAKCGSCKVENEIKRKNNLKLNKKLPPKKSFCRTCAVSINSRFRYCDDCSFSYYKVYRPRCEFRFNPLNYKDRIDCSLIYKFGRYSPSNKGNNLNGASMDHMFSVRDGFSLGVDPIIIKHPANCKIMIHNDNSSKHYKSSITLDNLKDRIYIWDLPES